MRMKVGLCTVGLLLVSLMASAQVDTSYIYRTGLPYGTLDIRLAKSSTRYYYLEEGKTFSFRESSPGVKTNSFRDMTSWDSSPYMQGNLREKNGTADYFIMNYRLLMPMSYNASYAEGYPLVIMMHGAGERGNCWANNCFWATPSYNPLVNDPPAPKTSSSELLNNDYNLLHGGSVHLQARNTAGGRLPNDPSMPTRAFPGFVLFPQNLNGWNSGTVQDAIRIIRLLTKKYNIDPNRIYVHGLSAGGVGVYEIIKRAPWLFAAALPMSAPGESGIISQGLVPNTSSIPLWIFQGGKDTAPTPAKTEGYIKSFRSGGMTVRYTLYPPIGHGVWNTAYNEGDFFTWMLGKNKSEIHVYGDNPSVCGTNGQGARLDLGPGFLAYQWERNGVIISGANGPTYIATTPGTYRARFSRKSRTPSEAQWNKWSKPVTVTTTSPAQAVIAQTGTTHLKDLNFYNTAHLYSLNKADKYYWYKNGTLLDLPGSMDDTTRFVKIFSGDCSTGVCAGNGSYTLVTATYGNCPSPTSTAVQVYFNDQSPINITAPSTFSGSATSPSTISLNWTDASSNEKGFEIWRRKQTGTTFTKWEMPVLTAPNVRNYTDTKLEPNSLYQYKIRAVSNSGRSNYTPAASNQYLQISTQGDTQAPSVPQNPFASSTGIREITLTWNASTDNTGIREYLIYYGSTVVGTGQPVTTYVLKNLPLNTNFSFTIRAKDLGGNLSGPSVAANGNTFVNGLFYEHSTGAWTDLDQINWTMAEFKGKVSNFTLGPRTQEDYFNFEFDGYLYIRSGGSYQFQTISDDGSRLTLNNSMIVDNDGAHGTRTITSAVVSLGAGAHLINVKYFENTGGQNLTVRYMGPDTGNAWLTIPNSALTSGTSGSAATMMASEEMMMTTTTGDAEETEPLVDVFPNPARHGESLTLKIQSNSKHPAHVRLTDLAGNSFFENTYSADELNESEVPIGTGMSLNRGIYILLIRQEDKTIQKRIVIKD